MNTRQPEAPKTRVTFTLPSPGVLRRLDQAHEQGFRRFLRDIGHNARNLAHRRRASTALVTLMKGLSGEGPPPDYDGDPYVAAAYMVKYHLSHCMMAYWAFKLLFDRIGVPRTLYVCDVGAGTGATRIGLALALSQRKEVSSTIYFNAIEPSGWMRDAGNAFWETWRQDADLIYWEDDAVPERSPIPDADGTLRVVTAFHLSLPWDDEHWVGIDSAQRSIRAALDLVCPHIGLFTANSKKKDALAWVVDDPDRWDDGLSTKYDIPSDHDGVSECSRFYTACAEDLGFKVPEGSPVRTWSLYRFSPPSGVLLLQVKRADQEEREQRERAEAAEREQERQAEEERREQAAREERKRQQRAMAPSSPAGPAGLPGHRAKAKRQAAARAGLQRRQQAAARAEAERRQQERERRERAAREERERQQRAMAPSSPAGPAGLPGHRAKAKRQAAARAELQRRQQKRKPRGILGRLWNALRGRN